MASNKDVLLIALLAAVLPVLLSAAHADPFSMLPQDDWESADCVNVRKASTQEFHCVFPGSVKPLYERGWGTPGKAWWDVCNEHVSHSGGCISMEHYTTPLDVCIGPDHQLACIDLDYLPTTIPDCRDKYYFGYLADIGFDGNIWPHDFATYAAERCDLPDTVDAYGGDCVRWWYRYGELSSGGGLDEAEFVHRYCIDGNEPDWSSWGTLHFTLTTKDLKKTGLLDDLTLIWLAYCTEYSPCFFEQNGSNSTLACAQEHRSVYDSVVSRLMRDPDAGGYSCELAPNPLLKCPGFTFEFNGTDYFDIWFDDDAMGFACTHSEFEDMDGDLINDRHDECPGLLEDYEDPGRDPGFHGNQEWVRDAKTLANDGCPLEGGTGTDWRPLDLRAEVADNVITLTWEAPNDSADGYVVHYGRNHVWLSHQHVDGTEWSLSADYDGSTYMFAVSTFYNDPGDTRTASPIVRIYGVDVPDEEPADRAPAGEEHTVLILPGSDVPWCEAEDSCLRPQEITITAGDYVTWHNTDAVGHTVTSGLAHGGPTGAFDSKLLPPGGTFSAALDVPGTYEYNCVIHPWINGEVAVMGPRSVDAPEAPTVQDLSGEPELAAALVADQKPVEKQHCVEVAKREKPGKFTCFYTEKEANDFRDACSLYGPGKTIVCTRYYWLGTEATSKCPPRDHPPGIDVCGPVLVYKRVG
ncbi:MAG: plastocyanin/azurin family copper-binding protein [Nitrosopumilus sp.]|nr:plastocyanin/azurin family copper-binding protein [Nitrosopumilus sp.]